MDLEKQTVVDFIRERGDHERLAEAEELLPDRLELPRDEGLLARLGVSPDDMDDSGIAE